MHWQPLPPRKYSWYSFLLGAESTQHQSATRRIKSKKNSSDTISNQTHDLPACSTVLHGKNKISMPHKSLCSPQRMGFWCYHPTHPALGMLLSLCKPVTQSQLSITYHSSAHLYKGQLHECFSLSLLTFCHLCPFFSKYFVKSMTSKQKFFFLCTVAGG
jgi:hypothetical protein